MNMKITLINPTPPDISSFGVRALAAYLKMHKKEVQLIFLPGGVEKFKYKIGLKYEYEKPIIEQVLDICRGSDIVGISFMSNYLDRAMQLSRAIKSTFDSLLIVGGIHPTVMPEKCLEFADIVCIGEGEEALLDLVERIEEGKDYLDVKNLHIKQKNKIIRNSIRPLIQNLDSLPFYDFTTKGHYIYDNITNHIKPMSKELLRRAFPMEPHLEGSFNDNYTRTRSYKTMTTRGCPHHCSFCAEKTLSDLYKDQRYLRKRSPKHVMEELLWVKRELPFVESIFLFDDTFLARPTKEVREFMQIYKDTIGMPFHIQVSPSTVNEEKMEALVDAGLAFVETGIQSMSKRGKEIYKRKIPEETILKAAHIFHKYRNKIHPPCYHVILDNPWETPHDVVETLHTVLQLPRPFWLKRASLVCFPGTELYMKAKQDGIIRTEEDEWKEIYSKHLHTPKGSYVNLLMYLAGFSYFPRRIVRFLSKELFIELFDKRSLSGLYILLNRFGEWLIILSKGLKSLIRGDFFRIYKFLQK